MTSTATPTVSELQQLIKQKDDLEKEINEIQAFLTSPGNLGLRGGLIDKEG